MGRRTLRFVLGNVAVLVVVWMSLVLLSAVVNDVLDAVKARFPSHDSRADLPNYTDRERARQIFAGAKATIEVYEPFVAWLREPQQTPLVNIDERGFRMHGAGRDDPAGGPSVGFFGGSTMWGTGVADDDTIPAIYDQRTRGRRVTNYGQGGHNARQNLALLANQVAEGSQPDEVVFYNGFNHVWVHCNDAVTTSPNGHMEERRFRREVAERPPGGRFFRDVVAPPLGLIVRLIGRKRFVRNEYACSGDPERAERVAEALVRIWEMGYAVTRSTGGRFHAVLQPVASIGHARLDHLELDEELGDQLRVVYPIIQRKLAERKAPWIHDLTDVFDGDEILYIDDVHVSRPGNEIVADRLVSLLDAGRAR